MTIDESARRIAAFVWVERRLFELLGRWVATTPEPAAKVALSSASRRCGEHALELAALLPVTRDHAPDDLVASASVDAASFDAATTLEGTDARLARLRELAGTHVAGLEAYLTAASAVRDAPGMRVVAQVLADHRGLLGRLERSTLA
jgi:hypothetical protein